MVDHEMAISELRALVRVPGSLRIITAVVRPDLADPDNAMAVRPGVLAADPDVYKRASTHVCHDVVRIDGPDDRGVMRAESAEGDICTGLPAALLARLREAGRGE